METPEKQTLPALTNANGAAPAKSKPYAIVPTTFDQFLKLAEMIADSDLAPKDYKNKPANVLIAMQMGAELGLQPMQSVQNIAVINGRPSVWGDGLLAILQSSPLFVTSAFEEYFEGTPYDDDYMAVCVMQRKGGQVSAESFSVKQAKKAGLWNKQGPWQNYPDRMLKMRARGFIARDLFSDLLKGITVAEEALDITYEVADDSEDAKAYDTSVGGIKERLRKKVKGDDAPADSGDEKAGIEPVTSAEKARADLATKLRKTGFSDRDEILRVVSHIVGRNIAESTELSTEEAKNARVIIAAAQSSLKELARGFLLAATENAVDIGDMAMLEKAIKEHGGPSE